MVPKDDDINKMQYFRRKSIDIIYDFLGAKHKREQQNGPTTRFNLLLSFLIVSTTVLLYYYMKEFSHLKY